MVRPAGRHGFGPVRKLHSVRKDNLRGRADGPHDYGTDGHPPERPLPLPDRPDVDVRREVSDIPLFHPRRRSRTADHDARRQDAPLATHADVLHRDGHRPHYPGYRRHRLRRHLSGPQVQPHVYQPQPRRRVDALRHGSRPFLRRRRPGQGRPSGRLRAHGRHLP